MSKVCQVTGKGQVDDYFRVAYQLGKSSCGIYFDRVGNVVADAYDCQLILIVSFIVDGTMQQDVIDTFLFGFNFLSFQAL